MAGTELSANAYARQAVSFGAPADNPGGGRKIVNSGGITFGPATPSGWSQAVAFGVFSAESGGNLLYWDSLTTPKTVEAGDSATFAVGQLTVVED